MQSILRKGAAEGAVGVGGGSVATAVATSLLATLLLRLWLQLELRWRKSKIKTGDFSSSKAALQNKACGKGP